MARHTHFLGAFALKRYLGDNGKQPSGEGGHTPWQRTEQMEGHTDEETHLCFCVTSFPKIKHLGEGARGGGGVGGVVLSSTENSWKLMVRERCSQSGAWGAARVRVAKQSRGEPSG